MRSATRKVWALFAATVSSLAVVVLLTDFAVRRPGDGHEASAEQAVASARQALALYQTTGNARFLAVANSAIAPWRDTTQPPRAIWQLRGRVLQTEHRFAEAAEDLSHYNRVYSASTDALLLEADAWRRAGRLDRARRCCFALALHGRTDLAMYCSAEILMVVGQAETARTLVEPLTDFAASLPIEQQRWTMAIHADLFSAAGEPEQAAAAWAVAVAGADAPLTYKLAYADVLLLLSRYQEVLDLLDGHADSTAALLRLATSAARLGSDNAEILRSELERRLTQFEFTDAPDLHLREEALYALWMEGDATESLRLAVRNWELQKGWEDTALVLDLASLLNRSAILEQVRSWQRAQSPQGNS